MRSRVSYANVVSTLALVVALGGTGAYAAGLAKDSVASKQIKNGAVKAVDIKKDAVTGAQVKESTLGKVSTAAKVDGITRIRASLAELSGGNSSKLLTRGPFEVSIFCDQAPTLVAVKVSTTADNSAWVVSAGGFVSSDGDFDVADGAVQLGGISNAPNNELGLVDIALKGADGTSLRLVGSGQARTGLCSLDLHVLG